jgi:hypothetical protein
VISERELDVLLADAAGVRDVDLPALPEDLRTLFTDDGPADPGLALVVDDPAAADEGASVVAARQLVAGARDARTAARPRRRPRRRTVVRLATAVVAVAAAGGTDHRAELQLRGAFTRRQVVQVDPHGHVWLHRPQHRHRPGRQRVVSELHQRIALPLGSRPLVGRRAVGLHVRLHRGGEPSPRPRRPGARGW